MDDNLAARIAAIEAREQIRDLVTRYGMAVDDRDMDTVASLFTVDAVFRHGDDSIVNHGRQEILEFYNDRLRSFGATYHYANSHLIELGEDWLATGVVCAHAELSLEGKTFITAMRYHDQYALDDGIWRFSERRVAMLYFMDMAELVAGGLCDAERKRYFGDVTTTEIPEKLPSWQRFFASA